MYGKKSLASGILADAVVLKVLKLNLPDLHFLEFVSKNFGETLDRFHQFMQYTFCFSYSKLFVYDVSKES